MKKRGLPEPAQCLQVVGDGPGIGADLAHHVGLTGCRLQRKVRKQITVQDALGQWLDKQLVANCSEGSRVQTRDVLRIADELVCYQLKTLRSGWPDRHNGGESAVCIGCVTSAHTAILGGKCLGPD